MLTSDSTTHHEMTEFTGLHLLFREPFYTWSPASILDHFQTRQSVTYFPVIDTAETAQCKIDLILQNTFEFNQESHHLPFPLPWQTNPSRDEEWLILLHKFYYAVGLGLAYDRTQDLRYAEQWIALTNSWIDSVPLDFHPSDVAGRRIQNWIFAHYYFVTLHRPSVISPEFYLKFLHSLSSQVRHLREHLTPARNHRTMELCAIFLAGVVFPELREAEQWREFGLAQLTHNSQTDFLPDGVHCELSTDYHHLVLKNFLWIGHLAALNRIPVPESMDDTIRKALEFSLYVHRPDGKIPSISDGDSRSFLDLLDQGFHLYGNPEWHYAAHKGHQGSSPLQRSKSFPDSGYYILRSGWGEGREPYEEERYLFFDCGPLGAGNHGHFDLLNIEMAAYGHSLIVDPGRYTYHESGETNWRVRFRETAAHNTVLIDGKNQTRYIPGKKKFTIKGPEPDRELKMFVSRPGFDFLHGIARSHEYPVVHERKIFFLCPEYWIVFDRLTARDSHSYDLLFHLSELAHNRVTVERPGMTLLIHSPHLVMGQPFHPLVQPSVEPGWVSQTYGLKQAAPVIRFHQQGGNACFQTVLFPYRAHIPDLRLDLIPVSTGTGRCDEHGASCLRVTHHLNEQKVQDFYFLNHEPKDREYRFHRFTTRATMRFIRQDREGRLLRDHEVAQPDSVAGMSHEEKKP